MKPTNLSHLFEECDLQVRQGIPLETVLMQHPEHAEALRPLLETSQLGRTLAGGIVPNRAAQNRSRAQFLAAAAEMRQPARRTLSTGLLRFAVNLVMALLVALTAFSVTGLVSAQSLPGDTLYPVKRAVENAQVALTSNPASRLGLEETLDDRRSFEVQALAERGRSNQDVAFAGFFSGSAADGWMAAGVPLALPAEIKPELLAGSYVQVNGRTRADGSVAVTSISLRLFTITGIVEQVEPDRWTVGGVKVGIAPQTMINGAFTEGDSISLTAIRTGTDEFLALAIGPRLPKPAMDATLSARGSLPTGEPDDDGNTGSDDDDNVDGDSTDVPGEDDPGEDEFEDSEPDDDQPDDNNSED